MYRTNCQRWGSGSFDQTGIFFRTTPLVNSQKRVPGVALWTSLTTRLGAFGEPSADLPWHSAQCCSNKMAPAATACGSFSNGFRRVRALSGAFFNFAEMGGTYSGAAAPRGVVGMRTSAPDTGK